MIKALLLFAACNLAAQQLVVDRTAPEGGAATGQKIEATGQGFLGDSFRVGLQGETWLIDAIRVWAVPDKSPRCPKQPGDRFAEIVLMGAIDNPPVPGQPVCECDAMTAISTAPIHRGTSTSAKADVKLIAADGLWQLDFRNLRWSVPGATGVNFSVRATGVPKAACGTAEAWALSASPAGAGYRLQTFDKAAIPTGLAEPSSQPRWINVQVWAHQVR